MEEIKRGSCVTLKCGGPTMVVTDVSDGNCKCCWFGEDGAIATAMRSAEFHCDVLDNVSTKTTPKKK